jgi:membrane associated rhomboid family serine protease
VTVKRWLLSAAVIPIRDQNPTSRTPYVTLGLIALNVAIFLFWQPNSFLSSSGSRPDAFREQTQFLYENALVPCEATENHPISEPEYVSGDCDAPDEDQFFPDKRVRLAAITSMFLHAGLLHLGGNMLFLWIFGNNVEDRMRAPLFLVFYLAGGVAASVGHILTDPGSITPVIGASGAVAAVMGAYLVWWPRAKVTTLIFFFLITWISVPAFVFLGIWFVLQFLTNPDSGVAWVAHVVGFVFGALVALPFRPKSTPVRRVAADDPWGPYRFR